MAGIGDIDEEIVIAGVLHAEMSTRFLSQRRGLVLLFIFNLDPIGNHKLSLTLEASVDQRGKRRRVKR